MELLEREEELPFERASHRMREVVVEGGRKVYGAIFATQDYSPATSITEDLTEHREGTGAGSSVDYVVCELGFALGEDTERKENAQEEDGLLN